MRRRVALGLGVVVLLAGVGGVVAWRWWAGRPPYGPEALHARATLELVDQATADAALRPVTAEIAGAGDQIFLGRVSWTPPPRSREGDTFRIVVLDKRSRLMPGFIAVTSPRPDDVSTGTDGSLDLAADRYSWLRGIGTREVDGSHWASGADILVSAVDASPVTFQFVLHPPRPAASAANAVATAPADPADLLIALIGVGPRGQVYWAERLLN